ncbi:MAG: response regulator transcription factor [Candidatus Hodarchaeales archaeon]
MGRKPVILVVDDEFDTLELTEMVFESEGFEVWTAASGSEAMAILTQRTPDLMLLDMRMPDENGLEVCRKIRSSPNRQIASLTVIMFSARDTIDYIQQAKDVGAQDYITKPFDYDQLVDLVKRHLKSS